MMLQPQAAPGRAAADGPGPGPGTPAQPAQPAPATQPAQPAPGGEGEAPPPASPGAFGGMALVLPFLLLFGLLFLMNRGEKKKRATLESKLKRGDRVLTRSGIKGKLLEVGEATVKVEIAPGVNVQMVKAAVEGLDPGESAAKATAKDGAAERGGKSAKGKGERQAKGATEPDAEQDGEPAKDKKRKWW